jgi:hypothetical protein
MSHPDEHQNMTSDEPDPSQEAASAAQPSRQTLASMLTSDKFRAREAFGPGAFLDGGLPLAVFTVVYLAGDRNLRFALWVALGAGVILALVRLVRRDPLQNVVGGFVGVGVAVWWANRTGQAQDVFVPGLWINTGFGVAYVVSVLVRWPLIGVVVGVVMGQGFSWRDDPALLRAYSMATMLFVGLFALRLAVQLPLYFSGEDQIGWLATARLAMGIPLFALVAYVAYLVVRPAYHAHTARVDHVKQG